MDQTLINFAATRPFPLMTMLGFALLNLDA